MSIFLVQLIVEVLLIYLGVILIVSAQVCLANDFPDYSTPIDELEIQTGDILGVGYRHIFGCFVTTWSGSIWSHTGIAWRNPSTNELYVLEAAVYGKAWSGVFRIPFQTWLRINHKHHLCHLRLQGTKPIDFSHRIERAFFEFEEMSLDGFNADWYRFFRRTPYQPEPSRKRYTCHEITIAVLQKVGVFQKQWTCGSYFASQVINRNIPTETAFLYADPVELLYKET